MLEHRPRLSGHPHALARAKREHAALRRKGWADGVLKGTEEVLILWGHGRFRNTIVGLMVFELLEGGVYWVTLSWVATALRKHGHWTRMWKRVVQIAKRRGVWRIDSGVHVDNTVMREVSKSVGRKARYIWYQYEVK